MTWVDLHISLRPGLACIPMPRLTCSSPHPGYLHPHALGWPASSCPGLTFNSRRPWLTCIPLPWIDLYLPAHLLDLHNSPRLTFILPVLCWVDPRQCRHCVWISCCAGISGLDTSLDNPLHLHQRISTTQERARGMIRKGLGDEEGEWREEGYRREGGGGGGGLKQRDEELETGIEFVHHDILILRISLAGGTSDNRFPFNPTHKPLLIPVFHSGLSSTPRVDLTVPPPASPPPPPPWSSRRHPPPPPPPVGKEGWGNEEIFALAYLFAQEA